MVFTLALLGYCTNHPVRHKPILCVLFIPGLVKSIGVSNYLMRHLEEMRSYAIFPPSVNQVYITNRKKMCASKLRGKCGVKLFAQEKIENRLIQKRSTKTKICKLKMLHYSFQKSFR